ncbi:hypothetical protein PCL_09556 [Purpureocillium lilacinum]|uniref:VOC domain-containing protein n=1 Tax=Purpureocillium lilacinum TaxID=33203 RepID=A0A2U3DQK6_PURLI|nr:hypothetical protein PCL_09556 [Purpureocillium lilacinum]
MATDSKTKSNVGIWITVTDPTRARDFYSNVLGWTCAAKGRLSAVEGITETYYFAKGSKINGCFCVMDRARIIPTFDRSNATKFGPHAVFEVDDVTTTLNLVDKHGGETCVEKTSMGLDMGFIARFVDTEGNLMGLYSCK